jgi:hypothetical protein
MAPTPATSRSKPMDITRRAPGPHDVQIDIAFCGVCHSDLHQVRGEWAGTLYPCVPGHEIVGRVSAVGAHVHHFKVGDLVGVGCMVDSCRHCADCEDGLENYCDGMVGTYNGADRRRAGPHAGRLLEQIVVHERYVLRVRIPSSSSRPWRRCCAPASPPIRRCALEGRPGQEGRHRRHRRPGPHGHQAGACDGRARGGLHHLRIEAPGCRGAGRRRSGRLAQPGGDGRARKTST